MFKNYEGSNSRLSGIVDVKVKLEIAVRDWTEGRRLWHAIVAETNRASEGGVLLQYRAHALDEQRVQKLDSSGRACSQLECGRGGTGDKQKMFQTRECA